MAVKSKCFTRKGKSGSYVTCTDGQKQTGKAVRSGPPPKGVKQTGKAKRTGGAPGQTGKAVRSGPPPKGVKQTGKAKRTGGDPAKAEAQREYDVLGAPPLLNHDDLSGTDI